MLHAKRVQVYCIVSLFTMSVQVLVLAFVCLIAFSKVSTQSEQCMSQSPDSNGSLTCTGDTCPAGLFCKDGHCECGVYPDNIIACNGTSAMILNDYCATFDEKRNLISTGFCLHMPHHQHSYYEHFYYQLDREAHLLNNFTCQALNRTGTLCGRCLPEHYPLAYSYNTACVPCPNVRWNWVKYIMAAYLPLTIFYLLILFFKINTTSNRLFALVYYCQTLSLPGLVRGMFLGRYRGERNFLAIKLYATLYGIWNLDFFRPFYSDLSLGIGILPTLALDYALAVYPLLLMIISYLLIVLYDRNYRVITIMWKPFQILFSVFRRNWDIRTSVIDAFSTFFFLSNVKFLSVSFDLMVSTRVYHLYGDTYNYTRSLYYSGDIEYFGSEHLPYAILAIVVPCVFVILPIAILALYPFTFFQKFLNLFPVRWYILHTFVDAFQGCYKNGTEPGTRDCRWFASTFFIIWLCYYILFFSTSVDLFSCLCAVILIVHTNLIATFQPFKPSQNHCNTIHITFLQVLTMFAVLQTGHKFASLLKPNLVYPILLLIVTCSTTPVLYALACISYWMYTHRRFGLDLIHRFRARITGYTQLTEAVLPDRMVIIPERTLPTSQPTTDPDTCAQNYKHKHEHMYA